MKMACQPKTIHRLHRFFGFNLNNLWMKWVDLYSYIEKTQSTAG